MAKKQCTKLTLKQERFVNFLPEYEFNATAAYKKAFGVESTNTAKAAAYRLLKTPKIINAVMKLKREIFKKIELTRDDILENEKNLAFSDIGQIFDKDGSTLAPWELPEEIRLAVKDYRRVERYDPGVKDKDHPENDRESKTYITWKYKFWDKGNAQNRLQKCMGLHAADKLDLNFTGKINGTVQHKILIEFVKPDQEEKEDA